MKKCFVFIAVLMLLISQWLPLTYAQVVNIPDPNLNAKIREVLELNPTDDIIQADMERIAFLVANDLGITDISGLETARNMHGLSIGLNSIGDISPLSALTELTLLVITGMNIADISALAGLTKMETLYISINRIRDISVLSGLTRLRELDISLNPIESLLPLENLVNLEEIIIDVEQALEHQDFLAQILPADITIIIRSRRLVEQGDFSAVSITLEDFKTSLEKFIEYLEPGRPIKRVRRVRRVQHCGIGWSPHLYNFLRPKGMIYALEFEYANGRYTCSAIEIRTGDDTISDLDGWHLYLGTRYNPSYVPLKLTHATSQITDNVLRLTPEMLGQHTFTTGTSYYIGQPVPSVHYVLKTDDNITVDTAYSCYIFGLTAHTEEKGVWKESPRRITSQVLRAMETPRIERFIIDPKQIYITYMRIDDFEWDRSVSSDWLLPAIKKPEVAGGNAPVSPYRKLATSWAVLKR